MTVRRYASHLTAPTPQSAPIPGREPDMERNEAGGYGFKVDDWTRLDRWLVLGAEGGTYYSSERDVTLDSAQALRRCLASDGLRVVNRIVEISEAGRAPKNDPAILALAFAAKRGDDATRHAAYAAMPRVCRIGTHLFQFCEAINALGGWSRGARRAVGNWYDRDFDALAYQLVKYRQREGWTHRDALRLSHPKPSKLRVETKGWRLSVLLAWAAGKRGMEDLPELVNAFEEIQRTTDAAAAARLIVDHRLPREAVPTELLNSPAVWEALLVHMPTTAMVRNLGNLSKLGVVKPFSAGTSAVLAHLANAERLRKSRIHPMAVLLAARTYAAGRGLRGDSTWSPVPQVVDALDAAFYATMSNVAPTGKRILLAIDASGSMEYPVNAETDGYRVTGGFPMTCREAAAAMALVTAKVEPQWYALGFTTRPLEALTFSPNARLTDVVESITRIAVGEGTDCAVPIEWAMRERLEADAVVVYTDNQTWAGSQHPAEALARYRRITGVPVRFVSAEFANMGTSIADPQDPLALDTVGLDSALPGVIRSFVAGEF
jgi:60 kDa SS-A/Ro ribonucleoprotein